MEEIQQLFIGAVSQVTGEDVEVEITRPDPQFGDFSASIALQLGRKLHQDPRDLAARIASQLSDNESIAEAKVAGPGFINIRLTDEALVAQLSASANVPQLLEGKTVVVEYSDPNPFKPLHAGHLYTTLVGDAIARLVEYSGAKTVRINYGGDVGLHVGKSMWAIVKHLGGEHPDKLSEIARQDRPAWLGARYVEGNTAYEDDEIARQEIIKINKRVYQLHDDDDQDSPFAQIYWTCRQWSYNYFAYLYEQLQVAPFDRYIPESEVTPLGIETVKKQLKAGVYQQSDGAVIFDGEAHNLHKRVFINSEGLPTYEAKDIGLSLTKWKDYNFDQSIIITANEQTQYMQVVIESIRQFAPEPARRTIHLTHGLVKLSGGTKMSSRKGNVVMALDILEAARMAGAKSPTKPSEASILAAVKYSFVRTRLGGDIVYDPVESVALEGNSGPYLQYAYARAQSILSNTKKKPEELHDLEPGERLLASKISQFPEVCTQAAIELMPHQICSYIYDLTQSFNRFYENNRVIGSEREAQRLTLIDIYCQVLAKGLKIIGLPVLDKM